MVVMNHLKLPVYLIAVLKFLLIVVFMLLQSR